MGQTSEDIVVRGDIIHVPFFNFGKEPGHLEGGKGKCICVSLGSGCNEKRQKTLLELQSTVMWIREYDEAYT